MAKEKKEYEVDEAKLYLGCDFSVNEWMVVHQPTVGQIVEYGERDYFSMVSTLCAVPSDFKSFLWDNLSIDWNKLGEFDFFQMLSRQYTAEQTGILFGDIDLSHFVSVGVKLTGKEEPEMAMAEVADGQFTGHVLTRSDYRKLIKYLRRMHGFRNKNEHAANRYTRDAMIDDERRRLERVRDKPYKTQLVPLMSTMTVLTGWGDFDKVGICRFMDAVQRTQIVIPTIALYVGVNVGMRDTKDIKKESYDMFRDVG